MAEIINKRKILNDPIYGFVSIPNEITFDIIEHPHFQRLRRIAQLGLTNLVYPGANHTRFHHAIGAMHLMQQAVGILRSKGVNITDEEEDAARLGILLHDIGHGPFSHALESTIIGLNHEELSSRFMNALNREYGGALDLALKIFRNQYHKPFLHQLISSQLDVDRLDYLRRDSFYTGVSEGVIPSLRLIHMMNVSRNGDLVIDAKGVYSVEKFLVARRLMYWQVYLHKTVLVAEFTLMNILKRARELALSGEDVFASSSFRRFLYTQVNEKELNDDDSFLNAFAELDDIDILGSIKEWTKHSDICLSTLSRSLINRRLGKIEIRDTPFDPNYVDEKLREVSKRFKVSKHEAKYFVYENKISNSAYQEKNRIMLLFKDGNVEDVATASDQLNIRALSETVVKHFLYYPKLSW